MFDYSPRYGFLLLVSVYSPTYGFLSIVSVYSPRYGFLSLLSVAVMAFLFTDKFVYVFGLMFLLLDADQ